MKIHNPTMKINRLFICLSSLVLVAHKAGAVSSQDIIMKEFDEKSTLTIPCNAASTSVSPDLLVIKSVELKKNDIQMAYIQIKDGRADALIQITEDYTRDGWTFALPTKIELEDETKVNYRDLMTIRATKSQAKCSDGGLYHCLVSYFDANARVAETELSTNYTGVGLLSMKHLRFDPANDENRYMENTTVKITCSAMGPDEFEFRWQRDCANEFGSFLSWPVESEIKEHRKNLALTGAGYVNDCATYSHVQDLVFMPQLDLARCHVRCQFGPIENNNFDSKLSNQSTFTVYEAVSSQDIITKEFDEKSTLTIPCNAASTSVSPDLLVIKSVELKKNDIQMAYIQIKDGRADALIQITEDYTRDGWTFALPTKIELEDETKVNYRDLMTIRATKSQAKCSDGGLYHCLVSYYDANARVAETELSTNYTGVGLLSMKHLRFDPANDENRYMENTTVKITCSAMGPDEFEFRWQRDCANEFGSFLSWPVESEIKEHRKNLVMTGAGDINDCATYSHVQDLVFMPQFDLARCHVRCQFGPIENNNFDSKLSNQSTFTVYEADNPFVTKYTLDIGSATTVVVKDATETDSSNGNHQRETDVGTLVTFSCEGEGTPRPNMAVRNQRSQSVISTSDVNTSGSYVSKSVATKVMTCRDTGSYVCEASNEIGASRSAPVLILVKCTPELSTPASKNATFPFIKSGNAVIVVGILGHPAPVNFTLTKVAARTKRSVRQMKDVNKYEATYAPTDELYGKVLLEIFNVTNNDEGQYLLDIQNGNGNGLQYLFFMKGNEENAPTSTSASSSNVGAIVGGLVGGFAIIAIFLCDS